MKWIKPKALSKGDTVAIVSPSWGGPSLFPWVYEKGLEAIKNLGLNIKEYPSARKENQYLYDHPAFRAKDINDAFSDKNVSAIIASIGGDDSVRILPYLDEKLALKNPKILMGFSDTTILTTFYNHKGLVTFNGPSVMAGFSQSKELGHSHEQHMKDILFGEKNANYYPYTSFSFYSEGYPDWTKKQNIGKINKKKNDNGWHWLQGHGITQGRLFGGCIEVLEFVKNTPFSFAGSFWQDKIFFLETSEDKPSLSQVKYMLRNYGVQGVFSKISALIFGRARDYSNKEKQELDKLIIQIISKEFGNKDLSIVTNVNFGHTDPQIILPLGIKAELNHKSRSFGLVEPIYR